MSQTDYLSDNRSIAFRATVTGEVSAFLLSQTGVDVNVFSLEEVLRVLDGLCCVVVLAAKNIEVDGIGVLGKVGRYQ